MDAEFARIVIANVGPLLLSLACMGALAVGQRMAISVVRRTGDMRAAGKWWQLTRWTALGSAYGWMLSLGVSSANVVSNGHIREMYLQGGWIAFASVPLMIAFYLFIFVRL